MAGEITTSPAPEAAAAPSFKMEDIPALFKEPDFQNAPHEHKTQILETVINGAYQDAAQNGFTAEDHVAFGDLVQAARKKNESSVNIIDETAQKVKGAGSAIAGLAKGIGAVAYELNPVKVTYDLVTGHPEKTVESVKTLAGAAGNALASRAANYGEGMESVGPEGGALKHGVDDLLGRVDRGEMPFDSAESRAAWIKAEAEKLKPLQRKYHMGGIDRMEMSPEIEALATPTAEADAAKITDANTLDNPENVALLAAYMATRSPAAAAQLKANLLRTGMTAATAKDKEAVLKSPGAQEFEKTFGKGSAEHLVTGADPVNVAMMALPFLRGAGLIGPAAEATSTAGKVAEFMGTQTAFGVDAAIQKSPTNPDYAEGITDMMALGGAMHGAGKLLAAVTGKGKEAAVAEKPAAEPVSPSEPVAAVPVEPVKATAPTAEPSEGATDADFASVETTLKPAETAPPEAPPSPTTPPKLKGMVQMDATGALTLTRALVTAARDLRDLGKWSVEMTRKFGDWIKPHLESLWEAAKDATGRAVMKYLEKVGAVKYATPLERAREAATMPNAPDSQSQARPLKPEHGGAPADYTAFTDADMQARAVAVADAIGSVEEMARLLASEDGARSMGLNPALREYVQAETLRRATAAVEGAKNDVDRIRATQTMRRVKSLHDVSGTEWGGAGAARRLAGEDMRAAMSVDEAIEKQQQATVDRAVGGKAEPVAAAVETAATEAGPAATEALATKLEGVERGEAPVPPAQQAAETKVLEAQVAAYFGGNTPQRVRVVHDVKAEHEAQLNKGVLEVNAAALRDPSTAEVARVLEHEIGHGLFSDPAMRQHFDTLWNSLDKRQRAEIENTVAERYEAGERAEEASVRALDAVRQASQGLRAKGPWGRFVDVVARLWYRVTGRMPKDPSALAARMVEVGVQRLRAGKAADGLAMSKRTDLLKTDSPTLAKLLNTLRTKITGGLKWREIFTSTATEQRQWELDVYKSIRQHKALQNLTPSEAIQLTREMSKAWQRERRRVFTRELAKQLSKVSGIKRQAQAKVQNAAPRLLQLINLGAFDSQAFRDAVAKEWGIANLSAPEAQRLKALAIRIQQTPEGLPQRKLAQQFIEGLQDLTKLGALEILENWWTAAVLSGWRTMVDIGLGVANGIEDVGLGSIVTALRTGNKDVAYRAVGRVLANLPTALKEALLHLVSGDKSMMRNFDAEWRESLKDGNKMMNNAARQMMNKGGLYKVPGVFMEVVARLLTTLDHVNSSSTFEGAKSMAMARHPALYQAALRIGPRERANARAQARAELTGGAAPKTFQERVQENARAKEILDSSIPTEIIAQATEISRDAALQGDPTGMGFYVWDYARKLGQIPGMAVEAMEKSGVNNAAAKLVLAALRRASTVSRVVTGSKFVRTAGNALNRQLSYVPGVGLLRFAEGRMSGAKADVLLAKQLFGTVVGLSLWAAFRGKKDDEEGLEGSWKTLTPGQKSQLYSEGKQPNTVWYRDAKGRVVSFNFNQWGIAGVMGTIGAMEDQRKYKGNNSVLSILVNGIVTGSMQFTEKAQLQGLQQVFGDSGYSTSANISDSLAKRLNRYAATNIGGLVPRIFKDVDAIIAPELHDSHQWWAQWAAQVPMLRELSTGRRVDILGKDITIDRGPLSRVVQVGTSDPAYRLLGQMNEKDLWLSDPTTGVRVVKLAGGERREMTPTEKDRYQRRTGEGYKAFVLEHGEKILTMKHDDAKTFIQKVTEGIRDRAAAQAVR